MLRLTVFVGILAVLGLAGIAGAAEREVPDKSASQAAPAADSSAAAMTRVIDARVGTQLKTAGVPTSPVADDAEFVRRVHLDLHGVAPARTLVQSFLADRAADKRAKLIDQLLADARFGTHQADLWDDYLIATADDRSYRERLKAWLDESFQTKPWNQIAYELLTATGQRDKDPAVLYLLKGRETLAPAEVTDLVSQYCLGIRLNCAQCHDHPFTSLKQSEYWGMAAFFTEIQYTDRRQQKSGMIRDDLAVPIDKLENAAKLRTPKFLGGGELELPAGVPRRVVLAKWVTAADNPFFARAMVNRMWAQMFGRGLIEPVDDMHQDNAATHPELLAELAERFVASGFDLRQLCRAICNSQAYQRTSMPVAGNERDTTLYSHMAIKVLTPEQLYDSLMVVSPMTVSSKRFAPKGDPREEFVMFFRSEGDPNATAYSRGIPQTLRMMNSPQWLMPRNEAATIRQMIDVDKPVAQALEGLYLQALARPPTDDEKVILKEFVASHDGPREQAYAEILWGLLNSSEFSLNH